MRRIGGQGSHHHPPIGMTVTRWLRGLWSVRSLRRGRRNEEGHRHHLRSYVASATNTSLSGAICMRTISFYFHGDMIHGGTACCRCPEAACCTEEKEAREPPFPVVDQATRTESGRPRSSIRL